MQRYLHINRMYQSYYCNHTNNIWTFKCEIKMHNRIYSKVCFREIVMNIVNYKSKYDIFNWLPFFLATWSWMDHWVLESFIFCSKSFSWSIHEQKYLKYLMLTITWTQRENNGQLYHIPITCQISSHNFL